MFFYNIMILTTSILIETDLFVIQNNFRTEQVNLKGYLVTEHL